MGIQSSTHNSPDLARMRSAFVDRHKLRDYKLSGRHLMKMVLTSGASKAAADAVRERFTYSYGCSLKWSGPTWDHLEMMGRDGRALVMVSHPYSIDAEGRRDIALLRGAGLRVVIEDKDRSWYGFGTQHVRVEHPAFTGQAVHPTSPSVSPALNPVRPVALPPLYPGESPRDARLRRAGPALLALAREHAEQLAASIAMIPCAGPGGVGPCVACELRLDYDRIARLIAEVEDP